VSPYPLILRLASYTPPVQSEERAESTRSLRFRYFIPAWLVVV
jgi:hypothetical protein